MSAADGYGDSPWSASETSVQRALGERRRKRMAERVGQVEVDATMTSWPTPDPPGSPRPVTRPRRSVGAAAGAAVAPVMPTPAALAVGPLLEERQRAAAGRSGPDPGGSTRRRGRGIEPSPVSAPALEPEDDDLFPAAIAGQGGGSWGPGPRGSDGGEPRSRREARRDSHGRRSRSPGRGRDESDRGGSSHPGEDGPFPPIGGGPPGGHGPRDGRDAPWSASAVGSPDEPSSGEHPPGGLGLAAVGAGAMASAAAVRSAVAGAAAARSALDGRSSRPVEPVSGTAGWEHGLLDTPPTSETSGLPAPRGAGRITASHDLADLGRYAGGGTQVAPDSYDAPDAPRDRDAYGSPDVHGSLDLHHGPDLHDDRDRYDAPDPYPPFGLDRSPAADPAPGDDVEAEPDEQWPARRPAGSGAPALAPATDDGPLRSPRSLASETSGTALAARTVVGAPGAPGVDDTDGGTGLGAAGPRDAPDAAGTVDADMVDIDDPETARSWRPRPSPVGQDGTGEPGDDPLPVSLRADQSRPILLVGAAAVAALTIIVLLALLLRPGSLPGVGADAPETEVPAQRTLLVNLVDDSARIGAASLVAVDGAQLSAILVPDGLLLTVADAGRIPLSQTGTLDERAAVRGVEDTLGVRVDGAWSLPPADLAALVDAAGGIVVDVETQIQVDGVTVPAGQDQRLTGASALALATATVDGEPAEARLDRFGDVLLGLLAALPQDPAAIQVIVEESGVASNVTGSGSALAVEELADLLGEASARSEAGNAGSVVVPSVEVADGDDGDRRLDPEAAAELLASRVAGALLPETELGEVRVVVRNGVGTPGLVAAARDRLVEAELRFTGGGNAQSFDVERSEVLLPADTPEDRARGEAVAAALGLGSDSLMVSAETPADTDVVVILGQDFADAAAADGSLTPQLTGDEPATGTSPGLGDQSEADAGADGPAGGEETP